jgi:tetratricopeptide (TPR) repeat protein
LPWRKIGVYAGIVALLGLLAVGGVARHWQPAMAELREQTPGADRAPRADLQRRAGRRRPGRGPSSVYQGSLVDEPDNAAALNGLDTIARQRQLLASVQPGQSRRRQRMTMSRRLNFFTTLAVQAPRYKDVSQRITAVGRLLDIQTLYNQAEAAYTDGEEEQALSLYHQVRQQNASYEPEQVEARLIELDLSLGRAILTQNPPDLDRLPDARSYFEDCLTLDPRNSDAVEELRLLRLYLDGKSAYDQGDLAGAIARLQAIYDQRPGYLGGQVLATLYDAYVRNGDALQQSGDLPGLRAYRLAAALPYLTGLWRWIAGAVSPC